MSTAPSVISLIEPKGKQVIEHGWIFRISMTAMSSVSVAKNVVGSLDYLVTLCVGNQNNKEILSVALQLVVN
eukprot:3813293-Heterocapsa_arctica.AAC.1